MENFKLKAVDSENQTFMDVGPSQFKKEFPDIKDILKHETNETLNDKSNKFVTETNQNLNYPDHELLIKKENIVDNQSRNHFNTKITSCQNESLGSIFNETDENSVLKSTNTFSIHPQDFDKNNGHGSCLIDDIDTIKSCLKTFSEPPDFKNEYCKVQINLKDKSEISAEENVNVGYSALRPERVKKHTKYVCEHCQRGISNMGNLKRHIQTHIHSKRNIIKSGNKHSEKMTRQDRLKLNECSLNYKNTKKRKCELCSYQCSNISHLKEHIEAVHNKTKQHKCELCPYQSSKKRVLKKHIDAVHNKIKQHKCELCSFESAHKHHLKAHIDAVHNKAKPYICEFCAYACARKQHLKIHIDAVHNKLKRHKCEMCPYECTNKQYLSNHIITVHTKIKTTQM